MDRVCWADVRDFLLWVLGPALLLTGLIVGFGLVVTGPLAGPLNAEDSINQGLASHRDPTWNTTTFAWSYLGSTPAIIAVCLLVSGVLWWRVRDWRAAAVPVVAILLQLGLYLTVTALIHRERPEVERLESLLPMSSYPSGHMGASTALYLAIVLMVSRTTRAAWRWWAAALCLMIPLLVAFSRLYRGMHHVSDLVVGMVGGACCALLAYGWYVRRLRARADPQSPTAPSAISRRMSR